MLYSNSAPDTVFKDRYDAGLKLIPSLEKFKDQNSYILALPRGGVEVAYEIAKQLKIPLTVIVSRKIGAPFNHELAIGAISEENTTIVDVKMAAQWNINNNEIKRIICKEKKELKRRIELFRKGTDLSFIKNKTVFMIDDGLATGYTAVAALKALLKLKPRRIIFAAPVCASQNIKEVSRLANNVVCLLVPEDLRAVGNFYQNFNQVTDTKVLELLTKAK